LERALKDLEQEIEQSRVDEAKKSRLKDERFEW
jgi:hypothetical protein